MRMNILNRVHASLEKLLKNLIIVIPRPFLQAEESVTEENIIIKETNVCQNFSRPRTCTEQSEGTIRPASSSISGNGFVLLMIIVICFLFGAENSQSQMTARGLGMGGAYTALARGVHAPDWNPANLGLPDNPNFSMTFLSAGVNVGNNSFSKKMYDQYNGAYLSQTDIETILSRIPNNGFLMDVNASLRSLCFSTGKFAFSFGANAGGFVQMDKSFFELPMKGNEPHRTYTMDDMASRSMGVAFLGFSYGDQIQVSFADLFTIGGTLRLLYGGAYAKMDSARVLFKTTEYGFDMNASYGVTYALGGFGWGMDMGAAAKVNEKWTVSLGISDLIGSIPWSKNVESNMGYLYGDTLAVYSFSEDEKGTVQDSSWTKDGHRFSQKAPMVMRLGGLYKENDFIITVDYCQGFYREAWSNIRPQLATGTEWQKVDWLPLRMGVMLGGNVGFGTSFGFGLRFGGFALDFAILNRGFITSANSKGIICALDIGLGLN